MQKKYKNGAKPGKDLHGVRLLEIIQLWPLIGIYPQRMAEAQREELPQVQADEEPQAVVKETEQKLSPPPSELSNEAADSNPDTSSPPPNEIGDKKGLLCGVYVVFVCAQSCKSEFYNLVYPLFYAELNIFC